MGTVFLTKEAKLYNGAKTASSISGAGKTGQLFAKRIKLEYYLKPYTKINSKWLKYANVRQEIIKLLEENIGRTLYDINHSKILCDPPSRIKEIKTKINKWDLIKFKSFCTMKETKVKRQPSGEEKTTANQATEK